MRCAIQAEKVFKFEKELFYIYTILHIYNIIRQLKSSLDLSYLCCIHLFGLIYLKI